MQVECRHCPLRKHDIFSSVRPDELDAIQRFKAGEMQVAPQTSILMEGSSSPQLYTALSGTGLRYKTLENGRRHVISLIFPGDFIGLQAGVMGRMNHSVESATAMTLCVFNRSDFWQFFRTYPERAYDIVWLAATEERFLGEALTNIGQRSAPARMAWALLRIYMRMDALGLTRDKTCALPFRQQDIADALGLSLVHNNKTLARLREKSLVQWSDGVLQIIDIHGLAELAGTTTKPPPVRPLI